MSLIFSTRFVSGFGDFTVGPGRDHINFPSRLPVPGFGCADQHSLICQINGLDRLLKTTYDLVCDCFAPQGCDPAGETTFWPTLVRQSTTNIYFAAHRYSASSWDSFSTYTDLRICLFVDAWGSCEPAGVAPTVDSYCTAAFSSHLYVTPTGVLKFKIITNSFFTEPDFTFSSGAGAFPVDGLLHCISVQLDFPAGGIHLDGAIFVDGVSVLTFSHTKTDTGVPWGDPPGGGCAYHCGDTAVETRGGITRVQPQITYGSGVFQSNFSLAGFDIYDSLEGGGTCSCVQNTTPITFSTCSVPTVIDTFSFDCESEQFTITGTGLPPTTLTLTGPDSEVKDFTIVSVTSTEMVLTLDDGFTDGTYRIDVTSPSDSVTTSAFCQATTYPICRKIRFPLPFNQNLLMFLQRLEFLIQSGVSSNASITINLSRDGGYTWPITRTLTAGAMGAYDWRVYSTNFGQGRNWVCEFITDEPAFWALIQCYADMEQGTS